MMSMTGSDSNGDTDNDNDIDSFDNDNNNDNNTFSYIYLECLTGVPLLHVNFDKIYTFPFDVEFTLLET